MSLGSKLGEEVLAQQGAMVTCKDLGDESTTFFCVSCSIFLDHSIWCREYVVKTAAVPRVCSSTSVTLVIVAGLTVYRGMEKFKTSSFLIRLSHVVQKLKMLCKSAQISLEMKFEATYKPHALSMM